jgi:hypothetical protein
VQWPEALPPAAWAEYAATKAAEDRHYDALDRARRQTLLDAATKGRATRAARSAARRLKVAAALAVDPHPNLTALAQSLGISRVCLYNDRRALGLLKPGVCPGCQRPL